MIIDENTELPLTARIEVTPQHLSTAGLVALGAAQARELRRRGIGDGLSEGVGKYVGVLVARALGGHVASSDAHGATVVTMFDKRVEVRAHLGFTTRRFSRSEFADLLTDGVDAAVHVLFDRRSAGVLRAIRVNRQQLESAPADRHHIVGDDITGWLVVSADTLERLRGQRLRPDERGLGHLNECERDRIYAIDRIWFEGGNWLDEVRRLKIYPYRKEDTV